MTHGMDPLFAKRLVQLLQCASMKIKFSFTAPPKMVRELVGAGWSQGQLGLVVGCTQAMISRMQSGQYKDVTYAIGRKIEYLWSNKISPPVKVLAR